MEIFENFRTAMVNCPELIPLTIGFCFTMASLYRIEYNNERRYLHDRNSRTENELYNTRTNDNRNLESK